MEKNEKRNGGKNNKIIHNLYELSEKLHEQKEEKPND